MLPGEEKVARNLSDVAGLRAMTVFHDLVVEMLSKKEWNVPRRGLDYAVVVTVVGLLVKATKTYRSIQILLERGLVDDAKAVIRVLFETTVAVLFILRRNSRQRARMYHAHDALNQQKIVRLWKETPGLKRHATKEYLTKAQLLVDEASKRIPNTVNVKRHWSGMPEGLASAAKSIGWATMYATLYRYTSPSAHATDFGAHVDALTDPDGLKFELSPTTENVEALSAIATEVFWNLVAQVDKRFNLGYSNRLVAHKITAIQ